LKRISELENEIAELRKHAEEAQTGEGKKVKRRRLVEADSLVHPPEADGSSPDIDMVAWDDYGLDSFVIDSLARMGFTSPTPIQHECLPAAILGNADIVGAAQTVRFPY
jgi:hypothetical protein